MILNKKRILFIANKLEKNPIGGREKLSKLNYIILKKIFKKNFFLYEITKKKISKYKRAIFALAGNIDGINDLEVKKIKNYISINKITHVFIDGSNLGKIVKKINSNNITIVTFCHNVESVFFLKKFFINLSFKNLFLFFINYLSEYNAVRNSDFLILLNQRDKNSIFQFFFKKKYYIVPISILDQYHNNLSNKFFLREKYALFVGSNFYGNVEGVKWYIDNVAPHINIKTVFVGKNLYKPNFNNKSKFLFTGYIKNLNRVYKKAHFVIAPILHGSGMKTKVAESLMYGKMIIGLKESFVGYEKFKNQIGIECKTSDDFIKAVNNFSKKKLPIFQKNLREIYKNNFSNYSMMKKYIKIFQKI
jgi:hypothetical protein